MSELKNQLLVLAAGIAIAVGTSACKQNAATTGSAQPAVDSTAQANADTTRMFYDEVFNKGNMAYLEAHSAANMVEHDPGPHALPGIEGFKKWVGDFRAAFPDLKVSIDDMIAKDDQVVVRSTWTGTQKGPYMGMPPTNKSFKSEAIDIIKIKDGKATDHWGQFDVMKMMTDLGAMKPPAGGPAGAPAPGGSMPPADTSAKKDTSATLK